MNRVNLKFRDISLGLGDENKNYYKLSFDNPLDCYPGETETLINLFTKYSSNFKQMKEIRSLLKKMGMLEVRRYNFKLNGMDTCKKFVLELHVTLSEDSEGRRIPYFIITPPKAHHEGISGLLFANQAYLKFQGMNFVNSL